jgi:hypothetical protein
MMFDFSCLTSVLDPDPSLALSPIPSLCTFTTLSIASLFQHPLHNCIPLAFPYPSPPLFSNYASSLLLLSSNLYTSGSFPLLYFSLGLIF